MEQETLLAKFSWEESSYGNLWATETEVVTIECTEELNTAIETGDLYRYFRDNCIGFNRAVEVWEMETRNLQILGFMKVEHDFKPFEELVD